MGLPDCDVSTVLKDFDGEAELVRVAGFDHKKGFACGMAAY
ncbi:hypothetical protein [Halodesulfurarchaeum sp.]